ncbi:HAD family hydrolase [Pedobacter ginsengiterrae]|uniref:phosphoglycolate phosphatase n=1 Tax=Pedobacter ginsengiterrae TaxID=871696 RepID=A0ABP7NLY6_9SPHI
MKNINLNNIKLVIFDVDGTLYDQSKLRKKMLVELIRYYIFKPWRFKDLLIVYHFRKEREKKAGQQINNLQEEQFKWCAAKINAPLNRIKEVVDKWIFKFPIKYLKESAYPDVNYFFSKLKENGVLTAIYSDYDSKLKLDSMNLSANLLVSSTDENINAMKPLPDGLNYILAKLNIEDKGKCLFIGDRQELDGICAERAGIPFLLIDNDNANDNFYKSLSNKLA